jgi:hypothetical protein
VNEGRAATTGIDAPGDDPSVPDPGTPAGFDLATVLTGSGTTLLLSAGIARYGDQFRFTAAELCGIAGAALVAVGVLFGLVLVAMGHR